ncbi:hypothetical protein [Azotobacter beijerinckii]|uniref:GpW protein n=1 Tax=Azotobacter beijerinckii TaxID=170623 RepID=A0A1I4EY62_9GAMM|nr:hypothetical protein [Azotobacter beijerinckii]SFB48509.1 hypothetical protein SAMN04244571_03140 [Azotobacter beijerinckii]SFL10010.1 hypothetical protein SAMN04244574_03108 [Azotobacter beijerinckii]
MTEAQQRLADVRAAIKDILEKGQSIRKDGRELRRADLDSLRSLEAQYTRDVAAEQLAQRGARNRISYVKI